MHVVLSEIPLYSRLVERAASCLISVSEVMHRKQAWRGGGGFCLERVCGSHARLACRPVSQTERGGSAAPAQAFPLHAVCNLTSISCVARSPAAVNKSICVSVFVLFCFFAMADRRDIAAIGAHSKSLIALTWIHCACILHAHMTCVWWPHAFIAVCTHRHTFCFTCCIS